MKAVAKQPVVAAIGSELNVSQRRVCRVLRWSRTSIRYRRTRLRDIDYEARLKRLAEMYPRFGYRRLHVMLRREGTRLSKDRVRRLCKQANLTVQRRRKTRPEREVVRNPMREATRRNQGWALDFTSEQLVTGERFRILTIIDECTREIVLCQARKSFKAATVVELLNSAIRQRGSVPEWLRSDNGSEFVATLAQTFLRRHGIAHERSRPGTPTDNARIESFHGRFRDELLDRTLFSSVVQAQSLLDPFTTYYNRERPHSSLKYLTPAEFAAQSAVHSQLAPFS